MYRLIREVKDNTAIGNLYTGSRCVKIAMSATDYQSLMRDGFFIRNGQEKDSADVINTTKLFIPE